MRRLAFIMGSNGPSWDTQLLYAKHDEEKIAKCLSSECGFTVQKPLDQDDSYAVLKKLNTLAASCEQGDDFIIYFSGHGELLNGKLFLLWDNTSLSIYDSAINAHHILEALDFCSASNKLLILDCCHAGAAVGFKGSSDLQPFLQNEGSQLVLCASSRLEKAREFDELQGSFLANGIYSLLSKKSRTIISFQDLEKELDRLAIEHNRNSPKTRVPKPYVFGEIRSSFIIKRPAEIKFVQVEFISFYEPNMNLLLETLTPFLKWQIPFILNDLPVEVNFPIEFTDRINTLQTYLDNDIWPCEVTLETKKQIGEAIEIVRKKTPSEISKAISIMAAAVIQPDGSIHLEAFSKSLEVYLSAKLFATLRLLRDMWLNNEPTTPWKSQFNHLAHVWSNDVIYGLTYTIQYKHNWYFWTDADLLLNEKRHRILLPQNTGRRSEEYSNLCQSNLWEFIIPQLLDEGRAQATYYEINKIINSASKEVFSKITFRNEFFIETETHNSGRSGSNVERIRIANIVAKKIIEEYSRVSNIELLKIMLRKLLFSYSSLGDLSTLVFNEKPEWKKLALSELEK